MADSPAAEAEPDTDSLTQLQRKLDDLGVMFYTYVGIMQRDAPPEARAPDEADEVANDDAMRKELAEKAPEYAKDVVRTSKEIDELIAKVESDLALAGGDEKAALVTADAESVAAGEGLDEAAAAAAKLLADVRGVIAMRDQDEAPGAQKATDRMAVESW